MTAEKIINMTNNAVCVPVVSVLESVSVIIILSVPVSKCRCTSKLTGIYSFPNPRKIRG